MWERWWGGRWGKTQLSKDFYLFLDPGLGFEPRITGPEPVVMPFHYPGVSES
jgi:hypothetical protein